MAEYEALIQNLRSIDEYDTGYAKLIYDAADAIEELSYKYQKALDDLVKQAYQPKEET